MAVSIPENPAQGDPSIISLMHGLVAAEGTKGNPSLIGDKGTAAGIGQWSNEINGVPQKLRPGEIPANFQADAKSLGLNPNDFSLANQNKVLYGVLAQDKKDGLTPAQSLSKWNSGRPNAYNNAPVEKSGVSPTGIQNVADYVKRGLAAAQEYAQSQRSASNQPVVALNAPSETSQPSSSAAGGFPVTPLNIPQQVTQAEQTAQKQPTHSPESLLQQASNVADFLVPGAKTAGEFLGTHLAEALASPSGSKFIKKYEPGPTPGEAAAAAGELGLQAGAYGSGLGELSVPARIGLQAGLGAGIGGLSQVAQGKSGSSAATGALLGGATGAALGGATEGLSNILNTLPKRIIEARFPKLSTDAAEHLLNNVPLGTTGKMLADTNTSLSNIGGQLSDVLSQPQNIDKTLNSFTVRNNILTGNPEIPGSGLPQADVSHQAIRKALTPLIGKTNTGFLDQLFPKDGSPGQLSLKDAQALTSALGKVTNFKHSDTAVESQNKQIGKAIYWALRNEIKKQAPETVPLYDQYTKESNLKSILKKEANRKRPFGLYDYLGALGGALEGYKQAGIPGAIGGGLLLPIGRRIAASPMVDVGAAKTIGSLAGGLSTPARAAGILGTIKGAAAL